VQNDPPTPQVPLMHPFEQHCALVVHPLPDVRHAVVSGVHIPPVPQVPLQHCADDVQARLSLVHWVAPHAPFSQTSVQQSCGIEQDAPAALHGPVDCAQIFAVGSQLPPQQSALMLHDPPAS